MKPKHQGKWKSTGQIKDVIEQQQQHYKKSDKKTNSAKGGWMAHSENEKPKTSTGSCSKDWENQQLHLQQTCMTINSPNNIFTNIGI